MRTVQFMTKRQNGTFAVWLETNDEEKYFEFLQYMLDGCKDARAEDFILFNKDTGVTYSAYQVATKVHGMRKRTFEERMNNITTYRKRGV